MESVAIGPVHVASVGAEKTRTIAAQLTFAAAPHPHAVHVLVSVTPS